jgi:hypothetical protein
MTGRRYFYNCWVITKCHFRLPPKLKLKSDHLKVAHYPVLG